MSITTDPSWIYGDEEEPDFVPEEEPDDVEEDLDVTSWDAYEQWERNQEKDV